MNTTRDKVINYLNIVWAIASKDIVDALKSRLVVSLIVVSGILLLMPRLIAWMIDPPYTDVVVYDPGSSRLLSELEDSPQYNVRQVGSIKEMEQVLGNIGFGLGAEFGLAVPPDFDQVLDTGGQPELDGYVTWANRRISPDLRSDFERDITELLEQPVRIIIEGHDVYPLSDSLLLAMITLNAVTVTLLMGITVVPSLLIEEKQTRTMEALLVAPASIGQVVVGKALAGFSYILVTSGVVFVVYWSGVTHWGTAVLFSVASGLFAVAVGLVLGSYFDRQQDMMGWMITLLVIFIGAMFVDMVELQLPDFIQAIIPWMPSVALAEILRFSFSAPSDQIARVWANLGVVMVISLPLYGVVVRRVRQSDR